jgi:hypothetical protein
MCVCMRACVCVCMWVCGLCGCGCVGGWLYESYLGNLSVFLLLTLDQTVCLYCTCSNCFENGTCSSHWCVAT